MSEPAEPQAERAAHLLAAVLESSPRRPTELAEIVGRPAVELAPLIAALEQIGRAHV